MDNERRNMIRDLATNNEISALIFWRPDELVLTLGYLPLWGLSVYVHTADDEPVLFVPALEPVDILPPGITVKTFPWGEKNSANPWDILYKEIRELLHQKNLHGKPVAFIKSIGGTAPCRMSGEQPPLPADFTDQLSMVSDGGYKDLFRKILRLYDYKTETDIKGLRLAHKVAATAVSEFYRCAEPGISEASLAARIECAAHQMIGVDNINFVRAWPMIQSGIHTCAAGNFNRSTGKMIENGDLVLLEMGICVNGYWADITRTTVAGTPEDWQIKLFDTVQSAQQAALRSLKPGVKMSDIDTAARKKIDENGYGDCFNHALGHQVGFRYHDPGAGLNAGSDGIVEPGMVLTVEPGIYGTALGGGVRIEDNVVVNSNGYELLSDFPRGLKGDGKRDSLGTK